jgi:uncharacterized protein
LLKKEPVPFWFLAALVPLVASQFVRLQQTDPLAWVISDYVGRLGALALLIVLPSARSTAFQREQRKISWWECSLWIILLLFVDVVILRRLELSVTAWFPGTAFGGYPSSRGWLHFTDVVFGLALVAYSEEIIFRRCARHIFKVYLGDGSAMIAATALLFGAYHWWSGIGNIVGATLLGVLLMLFYRRSGALWPVILAHYLVDIRHFA